MFFVQSSNEVADGGSENAFHEALLGRDDMHLDIACPQCGRDFEPDEARADDDGTASAFRRSNDGPAIGHAAQREDVRLL